MKIGGLIGWNRAEEIRARFERSYGRAHDGKICYATPEDAQQGLIGVRMRAESEGRTGRHKEFEVYPCDVWPVRHYHVGHVTRGKERYAETEESKTGKVDGEKNGLEEISGQENSDRKGQTIGQGQGAQRSSARR